jgi:hypothetical protein
MGRLIEEDKLMQDVNNTITEKSGAIDWINLINCQPTAYDPEKVVKQLEDCISDTEDSLTGKGARWAYKGAIEIVKGGGVDA